MPTVKNLRVRGYTNQSFTLYARDESNVPVNLSGATIAWRVGRGESNPDSSWPLFTKTGTTVSAAAGTFSVALAPSDTQYMEGDYVHEAWLTNASAQTSVVNTGRLRVLPYIGSG